MPGHQEELIERVAATGKPTVVVLVGGSAITMSRWIDRVGAVVDAWYPGEEGGHAVADVLFGDYNPAGRLPITFPMSEGQLPLYYNHKPTGRGDDYLDLTGQPLFPFGFGLSYTTFEYPTLSIEPAEIAPTGTATVRCRVKNTGIARGRRGRAALHARHPRVGRPPGDAARGLSRAFTSRRARSGRWRSRCRASSCRCSIATCGGSSSRARSVCMIGASSKDIRLRGELVVK